MAVKQVFNTSAELDYPTVLPTLDLDFANTKTLDPRITFTRASGGTYIGADGLIKYAGVNEARFDHDPETGESLGLLVEEARTNLFTRSEDVLNAWNIRNSSPIIENSIVAPDGTLTADSFIEMTPSSGLGDHYLDRTTISQAANVPLSYSIYVKRLSGIRPISLVLFANSNSSTISARFDLNNITSTRFTNGTGSIVDSSITPLPNGWFRLSISGTPTTASVTDLRVRIQLINQSTTYIGDGTSGLYIWGAQVERGSFPTSYIPTQGSTRTRAVDNAQITGKNFSSWYRQDEGTLIAKARSYNLTTSTFPYIAAIDDTTNNNRTGLGYLVASLGGVFIRTNNVGQVEIYPLVNTNPRTGSLAYKLNDTATCYNGGTVFTDTSVSIPTLNRIQIGDLGIALSTIYNLNGPISRLTYYPKRLPNQQLQALTS
jgi:hypothetical protein